MEGPVRVEEGGRRPVQVVEGGSGACASSGRRVRVCVRAADVAAPVGQPQSDAAFTH